MIPKHMKRQAMLATLVGFGLMLIGTIMGITWILIYMPK